MNVNKKEQFINDFWDSLPVDVKYEVLKFRYGTIIEQDLQEWVQKEAEGNEVDNQNGDSNLEREQ